ncbi:MAG: hypothetical protein QOE90_1643, partial [Thermoplasmata archaeon]|nr:hypothetical protein [Thermoplasmata archaeon]
MAKAWLLAAVILLSGCSSHGTTPPEKDAKGSFALREVASGFDRPVDLVSARDGTDVLYVVEQAGKVWALSNGVKAAAPLLDLTAKVRSGGEQGLLSVAFAPDHATSGVLYASYT